VTTTFTYYASGAGASLMATAIRPADGYGNGPATYSFSYTSIGKPLTATDPDSITTTNGYDSAGNLTSTTLDPSHLDIVTQFGYDATGNVTSTTDPRNFVTTSIYDLDRRKLEDDRHNGGSGATLLAASSSVYNAKGDVTDARAGTAFSGTTVTTWLVTAHTTYTPTSKPATVTDADTRTVVTAYDALDRVATITDPLGKAVHSTYDDAGELLIEYRGWLTPLQQAYATHTWTPNGKEASVFDALGGSHLTQYVYDGFDRLSSTVYADASHEDLGYDPNGNVTSRLNRAGQTLSYVYDNLDRLHSKAIPSTAANAAHTITSVYSLAGRPSSLTDSAGPIVATAYDTAGRATSETQTILGTARTVASQLDQSGNRTRLTWPDGYAVDYEFDALNRMSTATVHGGSLLATYTYDPLSRRTALSYNGGSSSMAYSYSNAGDLLTLTNDLAGTANDVTYTNTYTPAHQLASETTSNTAYIWAPPSASSSYATVNNLNQYPSVDGGSLTWDGNGNLATISGATYAHDPENRMVSAVAGTTTAYTYDPLGRRIAKSSPAVGISGANWGTANWGSFNWTSAASATSFLHDGPNEIAEYDTSGALVRRFVPGAAIDEPVAMIESAGATSFFHTDRKGSVIAMADTSGNRAEGPYTYDVYGNCYIGSTSCTTLTTTAEPFRYTGQRFDTESGLYYYRARYYCVSIGRFCETDPVGYGPDVNWYTYVGNDPADKADIMGLYDIQLNFLNDQPTTVSISDDLNHDDQAEAESTMRAAAALTSSMQAAGVLPSDSARALSAPGGISVSSDISGTNPNTNNFNMNMGELHATNESQAGAPGAGAAAIAGDVVHDKTHVEQNLAGNLPEKKFSSDPNRAPHAADAQVKAFNSAVIASEREAIHVQAQFLSAVPNLPGNFRDNLVKSITGMSDSDILSRYENR